VFFVTDGGTATTAAAAAASPEAAAAAGESLAAAAATTAATAAEAFVSNTPSCSCWKKNRDLQRVEQDALTIRHDILTINNLMHVLHPGNVCKIMTISSL
jgi:hypothetical protein